MAETKIKPVESFEYGGCSYSKGPDGAVKFSDVWEGACGDKAVSAYQKVIEDQLKLIDFFEKNSKSLKSAIRRAGARCVDVPTLLGIFPVDVGGRSIHGVYRVKGVETVASGNSYELILLDFRDSQNARIDEIQVRKVTYLN
ncbi:MAG: hypothetical protein HY609_03460, partial [Deltaproteobacteria bacterium]|nr:hypothetical protein [Deltaproteobacteria bacterium]